MQTDSQFNRGMMYYRGEGVPQNLIEAYAWFSVAEALGGSAAQEARDTVAGMMTPSDLGKAQERATEYFEKYAPRSQD